MKNILNLEVKDVLKKIKRRIKDKLSLSDDGERVDININEKINFEELSLNERSHLKRYEFAKQLLNIGDVVGDFACGTGYGTSMLSEKASKVIGIDINTKVIDIIKKRYKENNKIEFINSNIIDIKLKNYFDKIISFETIEHFDEKDIPCVLNIYIKALKNNGKLIFSVPYMQKRDNLAIKMGFHKTFYIDENEIQKWLNQAGFKRFHFRYQNNKTHDIMDKLYEKMFIICEAIK